jgi:glycine cleavage system H lipoate-binding protein
MENFSYVDIYSSKGIEYLIVIGFLFMFIAYVRYLARSKSSEAQTSAAPEGAGWFSLPQGFFFHQGHSWAKPESTGLLSIGMDEFAQKLMGNITALILPDVGTKVKQGDKGFSVIVDGRQFDVLSPVEGEVVSVNSGILDSPAILGSDPYLKGWVMKIKSGSAESNLKNLLTGKLAASWISDAFDSLRIMASGHLGLLYQDGGVPANGIARNLSKEDWEKIIREHLKN